MSVVIENGVVDGGGEAKTHALVAYILMGVGLFTAIPMIFGALWAHFKRSAAIGTIYHSHYTNTIRTFWWGVLWTIVGCALVFAFIGIPILAAAWLWVLYRLINGFAKILADEPYPL